MLEYSFSKLRSYVRIVVNTKDCLLLVLTAVTE
jgi:hypothetical protein